MTGWFDKFNFDDFEVNTSFEEMTKPMEIDVNGDADVLAAAAAILEAEHAIATEEKAIADARTEYDEISAARAALEKQLRELTSKQTEARQRLVIRTNEKRTVEKQKEAAERKKRLAEQVYADKQVARERVASFDAIRAERNDWLNDRGHKILDHQWEGAKFLATAERAILGDGMGLGKTLTSVAALDLVGSKRALVVAQADITSNFMREITKWAPHRKVISLYGMSKIERSTVLEMVLPTLDNYVVVVNYESWRKDYEFLAMLSDVGFDSIILDEAHNIKTTSTNAYHGIKALTQAENICSSCGALMASNEVRGKKVVISNPRSGIQFPQRECECGWKGESVVGLQDLDYRTLYHRSRSIKNIWCVTGTPILNKVEDLYSMLHVIEPTLFETKSEFLREYAKLDPYTGKYGFKEGGADYLLKNKLSGKYMARTMEDAGIVLPPQDTTYHDLDLLESEYPKQYEIVKQLEEHAEIVLNSGANLPQMQQIALITRQRQANVWPGGISWTHKDPETGEEVTYKVSEEVQESIKIDKAIDIATEAVESGRRVVVFSQFKQALAEFESRVSSSDVLKAVRFDGSTNQTTKDKIKHEWDISTNAKPEHNLLLANYKVGGTGLNLTEATVTIMLDREWNGGKEDQSRARTHRMGQTENTIVHVLRINKSVDKWLDNLIQMKRDLVEGFSMAAGEMQEAYLNALKSGEVGI